MLICNKNHFLADTVARDKICLEGKKETFNTDTLGKSNLARQARAYSRAISASEVTSSYNGGYGADPSNLTNLVFWAPFNEGQGSSLHDMSSYANTGTFSSYDGILGWHRDRDTSCMISGSQPVICNSIFTANASSYRYGFNGMEKDNEVTNEGDDYTAEFWEYDCRLGRRWNIDPKPKDWQSPYATFDNNPIYFSDPSGETSEGPDVNGTGKSDDSHDNNYKVQKGNTLSGIAKKNHTTVKELLALNKNIKNPDLIKVGQHINLPTPSDVMQTTGNPDNSAEFPISSTPLPSSDNQTWQQSVLSQNQPTNPQNNADPQQASLFGNGTGWIGPTLYLAGQPINALKPIGALGSRPGSSIASYTLSKAFPQTFTRTLGKTTGTYVARKIGTNVIGRAAGRFVPVLGEGLIIYDVINFYRDPQVREAINTGVQAYERDLQSGRITLR